MKVGIAAALPARCPALEWRVLKMALTAYTGRVMYLRGLVEGAARVDLDGNPAGEVTVRDAEYAAAKLAKILASREFRPHQRAFAGSIIRGKCPDGHAQKVTYRTDQISTDEIRDKTQYELNAAVHQV